MDFESVNWFIDMEVLIMVLQIFGYCNYFCLLFCFCESSNLLALLSDNKCLHKEARFCEWLYIVISV